MGKERCCIRDDSVVSLDEILKAANKVKTSGSKKLAELKKLAEMRESAGVKNKGCLYQRSPHEVVCTQGSRAKWMRSA